MAAPNITTIDSTTTVTTTVVVAPSPPKAPKPDMNTENQNQMLPETPEDKAQRILTNQLLARQIEYYFSTSNLSRDTYLSTLRDLNDSYVPISIIANFGKVQALAPYESALEAVVEAATDHSDLLEIVELDEEGKKITGSNQEEKKDESEQASVIILAVGSITGNPIPVSQIPKTEKPKRTATKGLESGNGNVTPVSIAKPTSSVVTPLRNAVVQNTIIVREVAEDVDEASLRTLFDFEGCPSIESIREDLHNCWFIALDTSSKDDMFNVMMKLRTSKYPSGDSVKARLKSSASASPLTPNAAVFNPKISTMYAPQFNSNNGGNNSRKKRSNNKGRGNNSGAGANGNHRSKNGPSTGGNPLKSRNGKDSNGRPSSSNDGAKPRTKKTALKAPSMGEFNFPSLPPTSEGNSKPFQVEKVPTDCELSCEKERRSANGSGGFSDSSSTATTSTQSTPTEAPVVSGGYAAALLKPAAPTPLVTKKVVVEKSQSRQQQHPTSSSTFKKAKESTKKATTKSKEGTNTDKQPTQLHDPPSVTVQPPVWGQGRSFADIVSA